MVEREEVRSIVQEVLEEEHLHNFTKIFEKEHNLFRGTHDKMPVPPSIVENYYTQETVDAMTHWRKDDEDDIYYDDGYIGAGVLTEGSVLFVGADGKIIQDNTKAYWHNTSKQLNIGDYDISGLDDFEDNFDDGSIGATWTTHNTDANRTIVEAGITLTITTAASTDARWSASVNEAPKLYKVVPPPPFEFIAKLPAYSMPTNNVEYGIFIGHYDADQNNQLFAYKFEKIRAGDGSKYIQVNRPHSQGGLEVGSDQYLAMDEDAALWFKIAVDEAEAVTFYVSDDSGVSWFQMQKGSVDYEWTGFFDSGMEIGFFLAGNVAAETVATFDGTTIEVLEHNAIIAEIFKLTDTDLSHLLKLKWNEDDSGDRLLNFKVRGGNRTLDLYENLTIGNGYDVTIIAAGQANTFTMNESFTIGNGNAGTLIYSAGSKTLTVEDNAQVNQDLTTDAVAVQFHSVLLSGSGAYCKIDSSTTAIFIADAHDADAYVDFREDSVTKWTAGYDYSDGKYKICEGVPGTNLRLEIIAGGSMSVYDSGAAFLQIYAESSGTSRLIARSYTDDAYVELKEQAVTKWCAGFDYTDSNAYVISEGAPGTNNRFKIAAGGGVIIDGPLTCGTITIVDGGSLNLQEDITFTGATTENLIKMPDNLAVALDITEAANSYLKFVTTNSSESVVFGKIFSGITGSTIGNLILGDGSILDPGGAISFGDENLSTTGHLGVGVSTSATNVGIHYPETKTITDNIEQFGIVSSPKYQKTSAAFTAPGVAIIGRIYLAAGNTQDWTDPTASMVGVEGSVATLVGSSGTVTRAISLLAKGTFFSDSATINNYYGCFIKAPIVTGSKVTNNYGLYIENQIQGATLNYSIYSDGGASYFKGTVAAATGSTIGNLTLADGSITDSGGAIDFGNENLSTTGTLASGNLTMFGNLLAVNGATNPSIIVTDIGACQVEIQAVGDSRAEIGTLTNHDLYLQTNNTLKVLINPDGNVGIGQFTFGTNMTKGLALSTGVAPTTSPADAFQMYSADIVADHAAMHIRNENDTIIKLYQQELIADPAGQANDLDSEARTAIDAILDLLENNGLMANA